MSDNIGSGSRTLGANRAALITGATGGLGYVIATALARAGYGVVLSGLEPDAAVEERRAALSQAHGVDVVYCRADLAQSDGVEQIINAATARFGGVDILVNNAVIRHFGPIETFVPAQWDRAMAVNVSAAFHAIRLSLPGMRARGWGRIVNMVSVYGNRGAVERVDYVTSKAALLGLTRAVAMETATDDITCNAICPGSVSTPGTEVRVEALMQSEGLSRPLAVQRFLAGKQPSGRFISADSVAAMICFLCGPAGRDITGALLPIDGGWLAS